jgi:hypothetical protein
MTRPTARSMIRSPVERRRRQRNSDWGREAPPDDARRNESSVFSGLVYALLKDFDRAIADLRRSHQVSPIAEVC